MQPHKSNYVSFQGIPITLKSKVPTWPPRASPANPGAPWAFKPGAPSFPGLSSTTAPASSLPCHDFTHSGPSPCNSLCFSVTDKLRQSPHRPPQRGPPGKLSLPRLPASCEATLLPLGYCGAPPCLHTPPSHYNDTLTSLSFLQHCELCKIRDQVLVSRESSPKAGTLKK